MSVLELVEKTRKRFSSVFGGQPTCVGVAPGRVEVLGNHTDYNEGYILSAAIDRHIVVAGRGIDGDTSVAFSDHHNTEWRFPTASPVKTAEQSWANYLMGVVDELNRAGLGCGAFQAVVAGDVPLGAGLSSSAAFEVATAQCLSGIFKFRMEKEDLAMLCKHAENRFVGMNCGILDQWSSVHGLKDQLIFLDCRSLSGGNYPLGSDVELVLANTRAPHRLVDGAYNTLREKCFAAAKFFATKKGGVTHLRDVTSADLKRWRKSVPAGCLGQATHIILENERVQRGIEALSKGDLATMGQCMNESHDSSRDHFGNSCPELDTMVKLARTLPGCYGCRLSGGGFGGCTVNLVESAKAESFARELASLYQKATGIEPQMHLCRAVDGASSQK